MIKTILIYLLITIHCFNTLYSQSQSETTSSCGNCDVERIYTALKSEVLTGKDMQSLIRLIERLKKHSSGRRELSSFIYHFYHRAIHINKELDEVKDDFKEFKPEYYHLAKLMRERDVTVLKNNRVVLDLINNDIIDFTNDHELLYKEAICQELVFYDLSMVSKIGEIGAGDGYYSRFLSMLYPDAELFINEIDTSMLNYINSHNDIDDDQKVLKTNCRVVLGGESSTNIEAKLDRIIIRNSFHHFSNKSEMIDAMKSILAPGGQICIKEYEKREGGPIGCELRMTEEEIINYFSEKGMMLVDHEKIRSATLMKFEEKK